MLYSFFEEIVLLFKFDYDVQLSLKKPSCSYQQIIILDFIDF